jgi:hypothetical protein
MASKQQRTTEQTAHLQTALWVWPSPSHPDPETNRSAGLHSLNEVDIHLARVTELPRCRSDLFSASSLAALEMMGGLVVLLLDRVAGVGSGGAQGSIVHRHRVAGLYGG